MKNMRAFNSTSFMGTIDIPQKKKSITSIIKSQTLGETQIDLAISMISKLNLLDRRKNQSYRKVLGF